MIKKVLFAIVLAITFSMGLYAKSLDETALAILKGSAEFKADKLSLESLEAALHSENNLPDPQLDGEFLFANGNEPNRWGAELSWGLEWPGVYKARGNEAKSRLSASEKSLYFKRVNSLTEVKKLLLDYILCAQRLDLLDQLRSNNDSIYHLSEQSARGGEMTALDINKVRIEYANVKAGIAAILDEQEGILAQLSAINGGDCSDFLRELDPEFPQITLPSHQLIEEAAAKQPEVEAALAEVNTAKLAKKTASMQALPSISLGYKHAYEDRVHFNGPTLGLSLPIFSAKGKQKAAKAAILESEFNAEVAEKSSETKLHLQLKRLMNLKSQIDELQPILKNADHNTLLLQAYKGGVITVVEYLAERNYFTAAVSEFLSLQHSAAITQIELMSSLTRVEF